LGLGFDPFDRWCTSVNVSGKKTVNLLLTNILYNLAEIGHPGSPFAAIVIFKKP